MSFQEKLNSALEEARMTPKVGNSVIADGKHGTVSAVGGDYIDVLHHDAKEGEGPKSYHKSKVKSLYAKYKPAKYRKVVAKEETDLTEDQQHITMAKKLKMPAGHKATFNGISWSKTGGYSGEKAIKRVVDNAKKLGFVKHDIIDGHSGDGARITHGTVYKHPDGWKLHHSSSYGAIAAQNRFHIAIVKESKDDDNSDDPIHAAYKYGVHANELARHENSENPDKREMNYHKTQMKKYKQILDRHQN